MEKEKKFWIIRFKEDGRIQPSFLFESLSVAKRTLKGLGVQSEREIVEIAVRVIRTEEL